MNKPRELWKTLKSMGLPSKAISPSNICLKDRNEISFQQYKKFLHFQKLLFQFLYKTWYLNYLLHQMFLLSLTLHPTMMALSLRT